MMIPTGAVLCDLSGFDTWMIIEGPRPSLYHHDQADGSTARTVARICRADLIVVDDIGMLPAGQDAAEAFYRIVDAAYERRSIAVTSNIHPSGFDTIMPNTLATATVDRLLHHAHLITTQGDSHRLQQALAGKGVKALT
jgi:DNA replication protein DnaC